MATDDASVFRAARTAAQRGEAHLKQAREKVRAARTEFAGGTFKGAVGVASFRTVGEQLDRRGDEFAAAYQQLVKALDAADQAIEAARRASVQLGQAARR